jgi:hypothetical protein
MLRRRPDLPRHTDDRPDNPLGARDVSRGQLCRIDGSNEPDTIGHAVSSGRMRTTNQDVIDLHEAREGRRTNRRDAIGHSPCRASEGGVFPLRKGVSNRAYLARAQVYARE